MDGDTEVRDNTNCTWTTDATGGVPPYSYEWFRDGDPVESGGESEAEYEDDTGDESFELRVEVADSESRTTAWEESISVSSSNPLCEGGVQN